MVQLLLGFFFAWMKWIRSDGGYECMMVGYESGVARIDA